MAKSLFKLTQLFYNQIPHLNGLSGWYSPIYCDNRKTLSFPEIRTFIRSSLSSTINNHYKGSNVIAVLNTGIPHGVLVAEELGLPLSMLDLKKNTENKIKLKDILKRANL